MDMTETRQDPDELLRVIRREATSENRGRLKIFFGYAAGVEKLTPCCKRRTWQRIEAST